MTDEHADQGADQSAADKAASELSEVSAAMASLTGGDRLLALGAAVVLLDHLIFAVLADAYSFSRAILWVAAAALFALWVRQSRSDARWPVPAWWITKVLGYSAGFLGAVELLADLESGIYGRGLTILGALGLYAGTALMFIGSRSAGRG